MVLPSSQFLHLRFKPGIEIGAPGLLGAPDQRRAYHHRMAVRGDQPYLLVRGHAESRQDFLFVGTDPFQERKALLVDRVGIGTLG